MHVCVCIYKYVKNALDFLCLGCALIASTCTGFGIDNGKG